MQIKVKLSPMAYMPERAQWIQRTCMNNACPDVII